MPPRTAAGEKAAQDYKTAALHDAIANPRTKLRDHRHLSPRLDFPLKSGRFSLAEADAYENNSGSSNRGRFSISGYQQRSSTGICVSSNLKRPLTRAERIAGSDQYGRR